MRIGWGQRPAACRLARGEKDDTATTIDRMFYSSFLACVSLQEGCLVLGIFVIRRCLEYVAVSWKFRKQVFLHLEGLLPLDEFMRWHVIWLDWPHLLEPEEKHFLDAIENLHVERLDGLAELDYREALQALIAER
jgi:hypothetical protein